MGLVYAALLVISVAIHFPVSDSALVEMIEANGVDAVEDDKGVYIFLPQTEFELNVSKVSYTQRIALKSVAKVLNLNGVKGRYLYVEGHTDASGSDFYNKKLSERRAKAVMAVLIENNVKADRMIAVGYGAKHPLSNDPAKNRRAQLLLYSEND